MTTNVDAKKILVIEDDPGIFELMEIILEEDYQVNVCTSGLDVLHAIDKQKPDLILLDLWIPDINGQEITRMLRQDPATSQIPIIIISAHNSLPDIAKDIGATGFLSKPFDIQKLSEIVKKYISQPTKSLVG